MSEPLDLVNRFCATWADLDVDALMAFFTEDAVYHNIPMAPVEGLDGVRQTIMGFTTGVESIEFEVVHAAADGDIVLNERVDRFTWPGGHSAVLGVMGTFEIRDGKIAAWRDYFDMQQFLSQLPST